MPASRYTTPELDAPKNTIRQIVKDECLPLESEYLTHPPEEGVDDGGPRGVAQSVLGIVGSLDQAKWDRLTRISKETGIYTALVPEEYGGGGMRALGPPCWTKRYTAALSSCLPRLCL